MNLSNLINISYLRINVLINLKEKLKIMGYVKLIDFTSLFEVSIAIHLLYSLIPQVQRSVTARVFKTFNKIKSTSKTMTKRSKITRAQTKEVKVYMIQVAEEAKKKNEKDINDILIRLSKKMDDTIKNFKEDEESRKRLIKKYNRDYKSKKVTLLDDATKTGRLYIPIGVMVAIGALLMIIIAGFYPQLTLRSEVMVLLIGVLIIPVLYFILIAFIKGRMGAIEILNLYGNVLIELEKTQDVLKKVSRNSDEVMEELIALMRKHNIDER